MITVPIGSGNELASKKRHSIIWTNVDRYLWQPLRPVEYTPRTRLPNNSIFYALFAPLWLLCHYVQYKRYIDIQGCDLSECEWLVIITVVCTTSLAFILIDGGWQPHNHWDYMCYCQLTHGSYALAQTAIFSLNTHICVEFRDLN